MSSKFPVQDMQPIPASLEYAVQEQFSRHKFLHISGVQARPSAKSGTFVVNFDYISKVSNIVFHILIKKYRKIF